MVQVVDMPLLFETKSHKYAAASVLVACDKDIQVRNLLTLRVRPRLRLKS